jgi:hypothetical protein
VAHWDGATWTEVAAPSIGSFAVLAEDDIYGFGGSISHWDGEAWSVVDDLSYLSSPSFRSAASVVMPDGRLWAAGRTIDGDVFHTVVVRSVEPVTTIRYPDPTVPVSVEPPSPTDLFAISGPAPNPVRNGATVQVTLRESANVRIEAFDALGRGVAVVHDGPLTAGIHEVIVQTAGLAPGVFVLRTIATTASGVTHTLTKRFTLAR